MSPATTSVSRRKHGSEQLPPYIRHPDFDTPAGKKALDPSALLHDFVDYEDAHMPDEVTREHARRMHYAAHRWHSAKSAADRGKWRAAYLALRDRIVLGNRKLAYRAVRRRMDVSSMADDLIGECHIVLINAVAVYNPWIGVRFSTYAFTCLLRALSRLSQRSAADWLTRAIAFDTVEDVVPADGPPQPLASTGHYRLDEFLRDEHPLLSPREKMVLARRFSMDESPANQTLEMVGRAVGLSKERVRQVQAAAIDKLRKALHAPVS